MHGRVMLGLGSGVLEASKRGALRIGIDPEAIPPGHSKHGMWVEPGDAFAGNDDVSVFRGDLPARNDALDDVGQSLSRSDADRPFRRLRSPRLRHGVASIAATGQRKDQPMHEPDR